MAKYFAGGYLRFVDGEWNQVLSLLRRKDGRKGWRIMAEHASGLSDLEFDDFNEIVGETITKLVKCADKHNIDRDSFVKYFATMFGAMAETSTFEQFGRIFSLVSW